MPYEISYQLYSSRNFPPLAAQLPLLRTLGYDAVEPWPPAYEDDPPAFRRLIEKAGLACHGFHMPLRGLLDEPERYIGIAREIGATYLIPPWIAPDERGTTPEDWRRVGRALADGAEKAADHGLRVAWHNHDFEYFPLSDGSRPIDHLLEAAGPAVWFEIDCGWVTRAGADPAAELRRYADRIALVQVKDTAPPGTREEDGWTATGDGIIDWASLVPLIEASAAEHIVIEHDNPSNWRVFAARSIDAVRKLGF